MAKVIDQRKVTRYCKRARALNKVNKIQNAIKKEIVNALLAGEELPVGGPYVLDLSPVGGKESVDWKQLYEDKLTRLKIAKLGISEKVAREIVKAEMETLQLSMKDKPPVNIHGVDYIGGVKLQPRVNDAYRAAEAEKAVA